MQTMEQTVLELMNQQFQTWKWGQELANLHDIITKAASINRFHIRFRNDQMYQKGVKRLIQNLLNDHWGIVNGSVRALGALGIPEAVNPLLALKNRPVQGGGTVKEAKTYRLIVNALTSIIEKSAQNILTSDLHALADFADLTEKIPTGWEHYGEDSWPSGFKVAQIDCSLIRHRALAELQRRK